jgi:hypothetical protein
MKTVFAIVLSLCTAASLAHAQSTARPAPKDAIPVDTLPPPPDITTNAGGKGKDAPRDIAKLDASPETKVTTTKRGDDRVEEFRFRGKLYKTKVTPVKGPAYYLVDTKGDGSFVRMDGPDLKMTVPMWILLEW